LPPAGRDKIFWGLQIVQLSAAGRWNDAADLILKQIAAISESGQEPGADLHAYAAGALRAAGRIKEAQEHDQWAERMALGSASTAIRAGNGYAFGHDFKRAADWWARAAIQSDPDSDDFGMAVKLHSDALLEQRKWPEAAATSEVIAAIYSGSEYQWSNQLPLMRQRLQADMARALSRLDSDRAGSIALLERCHRIFASDGGLADFFFPALREAGLIKEHDAWFLKTWQWMENVIQRFPESDNTRNTAAWFAARAMRKLDAAERHLRKALAASPNQPAYLDTMAEIHFARGNRAKAVEWSQIAVNHSPEDTLLRRQHERFRSDPLPR
jgi:tetratricopeptide (TPR) repeat protein